MILNMHHMDDIMLKDWGHSKEVPVQKNIFVLMTHIGTSIIIIIIITSIKVILWEKLRSEFNAIQL